MSDTIPFADSAKAQAKEGIERLLLAPVFLVHEIVAILFPGVLFIVILLAKGNHNVLSAFQNPLLGYKTKLCISLVVGYLIGKVFSIPADALRELRGEKYFKGVQQPGSARLKEATKKFASGAFLLSGLYANEHALDYMVLAQMNVTFNVTTGVMLLLSSLIPGDGFRWLEGLIGTLFLIRGYNGYEAYFGMVVSMLGLSLSGEFQKLFPGDPMSGYLRAMNIASAQSATQPQQPPNVPAPALPPVEGTEK
ncbi:MAG: hypothetical protein WA517_04805 [Candidatus Acidiferrum sp.]